MIFSVTLFISLWAETDGRRTALALDRRRPALWLGEEEAELGPEDRGSAPLAPLLEQLHPAWRPATDCPPTPSRPPPPVPRPSAPLTKLYLYSHPFMGYYHYTRFMNLK